ncbi:hypothetical protein NDN08_004519 [Rhodosorus marinus]|uniref:RING-type E3 ubiquitin transferase n=1 Tax=Rhodosorus marinus TaxID=101924 RepID=A0AAV8ULK5_9RHOD|nr:hypothetical protein NDN08_004519 [Rhodosorus marinus]
MDISEVRVDESDVCPICFEQMKKLAVTFPCFHQFCTDCLKEWAKRKKRVPCPLCNKTLESFYYTKRGTGEVSVVNLQRRSPSHTEWRRKSRQSMISEYRSAMLEDLPQGLGEEHLWRRIVYKERLYALGIKQCIDPRAYHSGRIVVLLDRNLREWIRRDLQAIFWTAHVEEFEKAVLKNLWHGIGRDELVRKLRSLLGNQAGLFVHELTWFSASRASPTVYDNMACYPTRRSRSTSPRSHVDMFLCDVSR